MNTRKTILASSLGALAVAGGFSISRADSPFPSTRAAPVMFSGYLSSAGAPLSGSHQISLNLWSSTDTSSASNEICQGSTQAVNVDGGNFQIQLDASCTGVFALYTQVWNQLVVDGTAFPLQQVGAAPYAARVTSDFSNGTRLKLQHSVIYGDDGYRGDPGALPLQDSKRNEQCYPTGTAGGAIRCMPLMDGVGLTHVNPAGLFADSGCTQVLPASGYIYEFHQYYGQSFTPLPYEADTDSTGAVATLYSVTGQIITVYTHGTSSVCQQAFQNGYTVQYAINGNVPLTDFVELKTVTD